MALARAENGTTNLHIWREGEQYLLQKGPTFLEQWNNLVFAAVPGPRLANTRYVDLTTDPLGFSDETFDAVYAYHVFEHLTPAQGKQCVRQIFSVLKPGGIFRLSVPDLETACQDYLHALQVAAADPTRQNLVHYHWAVMAIFEQMVRDRSGGMMREAIEEGEYDDAQLRSMFGDGLQPVIDRRHRRSARIGRNSLNRRIYHKARTILAKENVQWMYDRLSLRLLLEQAGFQEVLQMDHVSSKIPDWSRYNFDRSNNGDYPLDPSVYVEGIKPVRRPAG
jgi:SAM-dependent methyltransferase